MINLLGWQPNRLHSVWRTLILAGHFLMNNIQAFIFDLDGVIVDTAKYHFIAWRRLANELGFDFDEEKNEELKGVSRMESLERILEWGDVELSQEEKIKWAADKNDWYRELINDMTADEILEGVEDFLEETRSMDIKFALGSASKNAPSILNHIGLYDDFDAIIDGNATTRSKPDPQVFQLGAEAMDVEPGRTVVFEDALMGVRAALNGGFYAVGVGSPEILGEAHTVISGFANLHPSDIIEALKAN